MMMIMAKVDSDGSRNNNDDSSRGHDDDGNDSDEG